MVGSGTGVGVEVGIGVAGDGVGTNNNREAIKNIRKPQVKPIPNRATAQAINVKSSFWF